MKFKKKKYSFSPPEKYRTGEALRQPDPAQGNAEHHRSGASAACYAVWHVRGAPRRAARCPGTPTARYAVWYAPSTRRAIARATSRSFSAQPPRTQRSMTPPRPRATYTSAASAGTRLSRWRQP